MLKSLFTPLIVLFAFHGQVETKLDLFRADEKVGSGLFSEKVHGGHRIRETRFYTKDDAETKVRIINIKVVDSNAFPISEDEEFDRENRGFRSSLEWKVQYDKHGAAILSEFKDRKLLTKQTFAPIPGFSRADASDLWFNKVIPTVGTRVTCTVFDIEHARWQVVETTYLGKKWITVNNRQIEANEVIDIRDGNVRKVYLDDKGQPVLMRNGPLRTEKHF